MAQEKVEHVHFAYKNLISCGFFRVDPTGMLHFPVNDVVNNFVLISEIANNF